MKQSDELDKSIRSIVYGLVDAAPPAPPFPAPTLAGPRRKARRRRRVVLLAPIAALVLGGAAAAAIPALVQTSPGVHRLFIRTSPSGVDIRAYLFSGGGSVPNSLQGELSTSHAIGEFSVDSAVVGAPSDFSVLIATVFGTGRNRASTVAVRTGSAIARVSANFLDGRRDAMRPVDGWAILGQIGPDTGGTVEAFDGRGNLVGSAAIPGPTSSGEGFVGESRPTFTRVTSQGIVIIGHTVSDVAGGAGFIYPYVADHGAVQLGIEGYGYCRPASPTAVVAEVAVMGLQEGDPMTVLIVHAGSSIARVEVTFVKGPKDAMNTVSGQAVLATVGTIARSGELQTLKPAIVEGFGKSGNLLSRQRLCPLGAGGPC